jgi:hypothetical protein
MLNFPRPSASLVPVCATLKDEVPQHYPRPTMKLLLILNILLGQLSYGQKCSDDVLFDRFKKDIQIELLRYKQVEWDDETSESYYTLMIGCPIESLAKHVDDSTPAIRCLIFAGLALKNADIDLLTEILSKHKNDTAEYTESPTDLVITWTVRDFMQTTLKWKADKKIPNAASDFESRLETVRNRFRIIIPGEYHGTVPKDSLLAVDSLTCSWKGNRIVSFSFTSGDKTVTTNNIFNQEIKQYLRNMKSGDPIYIDKIIIEYSDKRGGRAPSLALELK